MSADSKPVWFITGCSTGLGRALAQRVLEHGHRAVVTARRVDQVADIVADYSETGMSLALDVNNEKQADVALASAMEQFGQIDVLVNNAGYGYLAAVEEGDEKDVREMFETNFFSIAALIRKILPSMRARNSGHIINISSVGGLVGAASSGYYNATKFALEGLTEALAQEVEPLGICVTAIEPGPFRTDWAGRSLKQTRHPIAAYADTAGVRRAQIKDFSGKQAGDPFRAADAIIKVMESNQPPHNLVLGKNGLDRVRAKLASLMQSIDDWEDLAVSADYPDA
ncbi:MAG: SDR family NAD(P)-dependent oxidoreductase [Burkholderiales bacterium]|nr:SDR family NAD(P)-dependent oxidoreductase [Burkholderiales bacterium]